MIKYKDLKKNDEVKTTQLDTPVTGKLLESPKQGRGLKKTIFIFTKGSEVGYRDKKTGKLIKMHDEAGSVYAHQVTEVKRDGAWQDVTGQPKTQDQDAMLDQLATQ
jgi:hypothetical protein